MNTLARLRPYAGRRWWLLPGALVLSALSALLGMAPLVFIWRIVRELLVPSAPDSMAFIASMGWWAFAAAIASLVLYFLALAASHLAAFRVEVQLRRLSMRRLVALPLGFFDRHTSGRVRKIIDDDASITHGFLAHQLPDLAGTVVTPLAALALLFVFDWRLGLASLLPIAAGMGLMASMLGGNARRFMKLYEDSLEQMNSEAVEYVRGIPVVKVFQQTVLSFKRFHQSILSYRDMVVRYTLLWETRMSAYTVLVHGFAYFLIPVAVLLITHDEPALGVVVDLLFYLLLTPLFAQAIMRSAYITQAKDQASEAVERVEALLDVETLPMAEAPQALAAYDLEFDEVSFRYPGAERLAIEGVSFHVPAGQTYALVGPSGGGKTTIARLVPRFWDAACGQVRIGGVEVGALEPGALMDKVSFVFQNSRLFKASVLDNVRFGDPEATREQVEHVIDLAQCREIIDRLPQGLDTLIGSEGTYLSGGEQQRIALARALLKDAPIVVLDEATAFADPENEHLIQQALAELTKGKTVLMIAHRLSSVMDVDRILVVDQGAIVERGTHAELVARGGLFAQMWAEYRAAMRWTLGRAAEPEEANHA
ncbi:MAG: ABC transporter ATP-binding protein [Proteobacteria bacterium]|nr:MAG: ABC transporter ATP-binding protein [Pseudomonadota bacterium]